MASPFKTFRKHEKKLIVFFGILLMISFLVVPPLLDWFQYAGQSRDVSADAAFTWKGGEVTRRELDELRYANQVAARFTAEVAKQAHDEGGIPQAEPISLASGGAAVATRWLLAKKAEEMGVVVDDAAVSVYLNRLGDNGKVNSLERGEIFNRITDNKGSHAQLMEHLRLELLAREMERLALAGLGTTNPLGGQPQFHHTPLDEWESYNSLFHSVKAELYPVAVEEYLDKVSEPTNAQISEYYDKYKSQSPSPFSDEPGFRVHERSKFAYVKGEFDKYLAEEKKKVLSEAVQKYYEENKDTLFVAVELPDLGADDTKDDSDAPKDGEAKDGETKADEPKEGEKTDAVPAPPTGDKPEDAAPPTPPAPSNETPANDKPGEKPADESQPDADKPKPETPPPADASAPDKPAAKDGALIESTNGETLAFEPDALAALQPPRRRAADSGVGLAFEPDALAALQPQSAEQVEKTEKPAEENGGEQKASQQEPSDEDKPAATTPEAEKRPMDQPAADKPATEKPATEKPAGEEQPKKTETPEAGSTTASEKPAEGAEMETTPPKKYKPLAEVEDQIRGILADREAARKSMTDEIEEVQKKLAAYADKLNAGRLKNPAAPADDPSRPKPPQASELAAGTILDANTTKLLDPYGLQDTELGKAEEQGPGGNPITFASLVYSGSERPLYTPYILRDPYSNAPTTVYLFWRTEYKDGYVPELDEVREQVIRAWKLEQARPLAKKAAEELAAKARKQAEPLEKSLGDAAFLTEDLSRMTLLRDPRAIEGVSAVDGPFLDELFSLEQQEVGVAMDAGKTHVYVIRLAEETTPPEQRLETFMQFASRSGFQLGSPPGANAYFEWYRDLEKEMQLKWVAADELEFE
jgi:hypothetical protein